MHATVRRVVPRSTSICLVFAVFMLCAAGLSAQQTQAAPQTARQALLEMFFSKTPGTLLKHLPDATRAALDKSGALANLQQYSVLANQLQTQGATFQTFETGPVLLSGKDPHSGQKFEVRVENDTLRADQDDIELTIHVYKNGQEQRTPFMPQMTFSMKQESQIWKLNEIDFTMRLPLTDPDLLKNLTEKAQQAGAHTTIQNQNSGQTFSNDALVLAAVRSIVTAETNYAGKYPTVGFTCTLSDLDGFGSGEPNEHQAMLINSGLASGKRYGYVFGLSGCSGTPAAAFHLTASPNGAAFGRKAFCADQSGAIRSSADGNPATCLSSGVPVH